MPKSNIEEELKLHSQILENMSEGVYLVGLNDLIIRYANPKFESMFGYDSGELTGKHVSIVNAPTDLDPEQTAAEISKTIQETGEWQGEVTNIKKDGTVFWCNANVTVFEHFEYGPVCVSVHEDITERKNLENELRQAQKMEAIGQLAGGIAHDFNNQLACILGFAEILKNELGPSELNAYVQKIINVSEHSANLTRQLLTFSRKQSLKLEVLNIHEQLQDLITILNRSIDKRVTIKCQFNAQHPHVKGDKSLIQNAFLNICLNARDAMPHGGVLTISTENKKAAIETEIDFLVIEFKDTGHGIPEAEQNKVFEPFFTTKAPGKGTGMGLASVYGAVKQLSGTIEVFSDPGEGACFSITFPAVQGDLSNNGTSTTLNNKSNTILVVDDEPLLLELCASFCKNEGYHGLFAANGNEAIALYQQYWQSIDLVILDIIMPEMSGPDVLIELEKINPDIKAIISSGYIPDETLAQHKKHSVVEVINKPFKLAKLKECIERHLENSAQITCGTGTH